MDIHVDPSDTIRLVRECAERLYRENALRLIEGGVSFAMAGDAMNVVDDMWVSVYVVISTKEAANNVAKALTVDGKFDSKATGRHGFRKDLE